MDRTAERPTQPRPAEGTPIYQSVLNVLRKAEPKPAADAAARDNRDGGLGHRPFEPEPVVGVGDRYQNRARRGGPLGDQLEVACRHRPGRHRASVGAPAPDRGGQHDVVVGRRPAVGSTEAR